MISGAAWSSLLLLQDSYYWAGLVENMFDGLAKPKSAILGIIWDLSEDSNNSRFSSFISLCAYPMLWIY